MWESGIIHRLREPGHAGSNPAIQTQTGIRGQESGVRSQESEGYRKGRR